MYYCKLLSQSSIIKHCFFGRVGGVSLGNYASLNTGYLTGDDQQCVEENQEIIANFFKVPASNLLTATQVHGNNIIVVNNITKNNMKYIKADALVTKQQNVVLAVNTADCLPILLLDPSAKVIAAVHAGWLGLVNDVVTPTVQAMQALGATPSNIIASIGPSISVNNYQVDEKFYNNIITTNSNYTNFFVRNNQGLYFNLQKLATHLLSKCGITKIEDIYLDTYNLEDKFFSHRRSTHLKQTSRGVQCSGIMLNN